jgi:hypothetical protein
MRYAYGSKTEEFKKILCDVESIIPHAYLSRKASANDKVSSIYNPAVAKNIEERLPTVLEAGRRLVKENYNSDVRVRTLAVRLLEKHAEYCEGLAQVIIERARGNVEGALELLDKFRVSFGKHEPEIEEYFDHNLHFRAMKFLVGKCKNTVDVGN